MEEHGERTTVMATYSQQDLALRKLISEVLYYVWDPIDVVEFPHARDEYDLYHDAVFKLLRTNASEQAIATYLNTIAVENMLELNRRARAEQAARVLVRWRDYCAASV